jgi:hypothetical protein
MAASMLSEFSVAEMEVSSSPRKVEDNDQFSVSDLDLVEWSEEVLFQVVEPGAFDALDALFQGVFFLMKSIAEVAIAAMIAPRIP